MRYEIRIMDQFNNLQYGITEFSSLNCGRYDRNYQRCTILLPAKDWSVTDFTQDMIIQVWRDQNGTLVLDGNTGYFLRAWQLYQDEDGREYIQLVGFDMLYLLDGRIIAYDAGTAETIKTAEADDMIKEIVDENLVSATDTTRNLSASYFAIETDATLAPSVTVGISRQYMLPVLQKICDQSRDGGTWLTFDIDYNGDFPMTLKTYTGQRGTDITGQLLLSVEAGNVANPRLIFDYSDQKTAAYVGGRGQESERLVGEAVSSDATNTIFSRREVVSQNYEVETEAALDSIAAGLLEKYKPRLIFTGDIIDTEGTQYGVDWNYGDKVRVQYKGYDFECRVLGYEITWAASEGGQVTDTIRASLRGEVTL